MPLADNSASNIFIVSSMVSFRSISLHFELGLAQHLANPRNDIAGALVVSLDVGQYLRHFLKSGWIGLDQHFRRAGVVVNRAQRLIELVGDRRGQLPHRHAPVHVRHFGIALLRLGFGDAAAMALDTGA